ncbi:MAG: hypothetical protein IJX65_00485 [Alistipes sp.]|nr:hypothetical protein [Alistipes sp.]
MKRFTLFVLCALFTSATWAQDVTAQQPPVKFQSYMTLGVNFATSGAGPIFNAGCGVKVHDFFYAGFETGLYTFLAPYKKVYHYNSGTVEAEKGSYTNTAVPLGINMKGYITKDTVVIPYIDFSFGFLFGSFTDVESADYDYVDTYNVDFGCKVGLGVDYKRLTIGAGYSYLVDYGAHCGYIQFGVRLGK